MRPSRCCSSTARRWLLLAARAGTSWDAMRLLLQADVDLDKLRYYVRTAADPQLGLF